MEGLISEKAFIYRGHNDTFFFDDNAEMVFLSEERLRFAVIAFSPHVMVYEVAHNGSKHWYNIAGPLYSVLKEAAIKGNLSLYYYDVKRSADLVKQAIMRGCVDIFGFPTYARMEAAFKIWNMGIGFPIGHSMDVMSLDHVLHKISYPAKKLFIFSSVLDVYSWLVFFVLLFLISLVTHVLEREHTVLRNLWFYAMSCLQPISMFQKSSDKFLATLWCLMLVVLMNYYDSQFFSNITMKQQPIVIDSLEDLAKMPDVKVLVPATTFEFKSNQKEMETELAKKYFLPESSYYEALRPRLKFYPQDQIFNWTFKKELFKSASRGDSAWLYSQSLLNYGTYHFQNGEYRHKLHVSKSGGDWQPMFLSMLSIADFHRELIETVHNFQSNLLSLLTRIIHLCESGIYHLWKQDIVMKVDRMLLSKVNSETAALAVDIFGGTFTLIAILFTLSFVIFFLEIKIRNKKEIVERKRRENRFIKQLIDLRAHYANFNKEYRDENFRNGQKQMYRCVFN